MGVNAPMKERMIERSDSLQINIGNVNQEKSVAGKSSGLLKFN